MSLIELLAPSEVPEWFTYPIRFQSVLNNGLVDFHPWHMLDRNKAFLRIKGLTTRFPQLAVVPFAQRTDSDYIACFEKGNEA